MILISDHQTSETNLLASPESLSSMSGFDMSSVDAASCLTALEDVLPLVIQHSSISKQLGSLCSLLCTSQQTAQVVMRSCVGRLHLRAEKPTQMAWFAKHWRLVRSLRTNAGFGDAAMLRGIEEGLADAAARCTEAMAEARGDPAVPQLQSVQAVAFPRRALIHLQTFTTLTSLQIQGVLGMHKVDVTVWQEACTALAGLTSLRCLTVEKNADGLLEGFSSLTNLTSLTVKQLRCTHGILKLRHLPPQLQELTMTLYWNGPMLPIDLSHVTGLTRLEAAGDSRECDGWLVGCGLLEGGSDQPITFTPAADGSNDKLPPNCRHLSVEGVVSAQPLLELQHLERLKLQECDLSHEDVQEALQQLSSISSLTDLQLNIDVEHVDEVGADVLLALPSLRGLRLCYGGWGAEYCVAIATPVLRKLFQLSALQHLTMQKLMLPNSSDCRLVDAVGGLRGLRSLRLYGCNIGSGNKKAKVAGFVGAVADLPELRDLRLGLLPQWNQAALAKFVAATQLTGLMFVSARNSSEFVSLLGQVHKLSGLRRLWMDSPGMDWFAVDAAAASITGLAELCVRGCDPQLLGPKFPGAALGDIVIGCDLWDSNPLSRAAWRVKWWSPAEGDWETE